MEIWYEVCFRTHFGAGGRSFPSRDEAEAAAKEMREAGIDVVSIHPAPCSTWIPPHDPEFRRQD